jgi:hypothetical protein
MLDIHEKAPLLKMLRGEHFVYDQGRTGDQAHLLQLVTPIELIMIGVCSVPHIFHVGAQEHLSQFDKVTVVLILNLHCAPRILPSLHHFVAHLHFIHAPHNRKRQLTLEEASKVRWRDETSQTLTFMEELRSAMVSSSVGNW